jgi:uronate dehydrogenase
MTRILITGSAGHIGRALREGLHGLYTLRLADIAPQAAAREGEEIVTADITQFDDVLQAMEGVDVVVHLAGIPDEASWERIRDMNIDGCYNVFEAARRAGVKRVIFASSNHAVGFHRRDRVIDDTVAPRPDSRYGVSKVFGEALGRLYADKHGMSVACLRIGSFRPDDRPTAPRHLLTWISHRDMVQVTRRCIDHPAFHFLIVYGVSGNTRNRWSNDNARFLGFVPEDDAERYAGEIDAAGAVEDPREALFHGGFGCLVECDADLDQID